MYERVRGCEALNHVSRNAANARGVSCARGRRSVRLPGHILQLSGVGVCLLVYPASRRGVLQYVKVSQKL